MPGTRPAPMPGEYCRCPFGAYIAETVPVHCWVLPHLQHDPNQSMPIKDPVAPKTTPSLDRPPKQGTGSRPRAASQPPPSTTEQPKDAPTAKSVPQPPPEAPEPGLDNRIFERIIEDVAVLSAQQYRLLRRHLATHPALWER